MKNLPIRCRDARKIFILLLSAAACGSLAAQDISKSAIQQNTADQQDVRTHTTAVVVQVQGLIDELAANGISGEDIKVLQATKAALTHLSGPEMDRVLASLQKAAQASGSPGGQQNVVDAYAGQKGIILQFRQILKEYEQRQAAYELPERFKELGDRQTETMRTTVEVATQTAGKSASQLSSMEQTTEQIVQADQEAIGNELNLAQDQLAKAIQGSTGDEAKAMQQAQQDLKAGSLQQALSQADDNIKAGHLLQAITEQKAVRDQLRRVAQDLNPATNAVDALAATVGDLAQLIEEQKKLLGQTAATGDFAQKVEAQNKLMEPIEKQMREEERHSARAGGGQLASTIDPQQLAAVKQLNIDRNTLSDEAKPLVGEQATLVDKTDLAQQDMMALTPDMAAIVKQAIDPMQQSRRQLQWVSKDSYTAAGTFEQAAIDKLEEAQKQLQQQLADAEKAAADAAKDPVAKLQDLQKQIQAAMQQQQQLTAQTQQNLTATTPDSTAIAQDQQQQSQLQQQTAALQQDSQPLSLPAAQALANADAQMTQAQQALTDPSQAAAAQTDQQAAQAALAQASQQIGQQIAQDQQQAADPAAMAAAADAIQQAQNSVSSAIADAAPPAAAPAAAPDMAEAAAALAQASTETQAAANTPGLPDAAVQAVQAAQAAIGTGEQQAAQKNAAGTAAAAANAQQDLAQAQAAVAMVQAGMTASAATPGPPGPPGPPLADATSPDGAKKIGAGSTDKGTLRGTSGSNGKFISVAARERTAIDQSQSEKRPQEYAPLIDQYMKNLADQSSASAQ